MNILKMDKRQHIDIYYDNIATIISIVFACLVMLLASFKFIAYYLTAIIVIAINKLTFYIVKKVKKHYKQPPTPQAFKVVRMFYWLSWVLLVGIGVWGFYRLFNG